MGLRVIHKFYCESCKRFLFGETTSFLAAEVNGHNKAAHPLDYDQWTGAAITLSNNYYAPAGQPRPQYTTPFGATSRSEWGTAAKAPELTEYDQDLLDEYHVKW